MRLAKTSNKYIELKGAIPATCVVLPLTNKVRLSVTCPIVHLEGALVQPQVHTLIDYGSVCWISRPGGKLQGLSVSCRHKFSPCDKIVSRNPEPIVRVIAMA